MHTSIQLLDLAKQRLALAHNLPLPMTDYRLGKLMGLSTSVVSAWRRGARGIGTEFAQKFALACHLPEAYVYACIEHERSKDDTVKHILAEIAAAFHDKVAAVILSAGLLLCLSGFSPENEAFASIAHHRDFADSIYIMRSYGLHSWTF